MQSVRREPDVAKLLFKANWDANWLVRAVAFTQRLFPRRCSSPDQTMRHRSLLPQSPLKAFAALVSGGARCP